MKNVFDIGGQLFRTAEAALLLVVLAMAAGCATDLGENTSVVQKNALLLAYQDYRDPRKLKEDQEQIQKFLPVVIFKSFNSRPPSSLNQLAQLREAFREFGNVLCAIRTGNNPFVKTPINDFPRLTDSPVESAAISVAETMGQMYSAYYSAEWTRTAEVVSKEFGILCNTVDSWLLLESDDALAMVTESGRITLSTGLAKSSAAAVMKWTQLSSDQVLHTLKRIDHPKSEADFRLVMFLSNYRNSYSNLNLLDKEAQRVITAILRVEAIFRYILLHEAAHLRLGHLKSLEKIKPHEKCDELLRAEAAADEDAIRAYVAVARSPMYSKYIVSALKKEMMEMMWAFEEIGNLHSGETSMANCKYPPPKERRSAILAAISSID